MMQQVSLYFNGIQHQIQRKYFEQQNQQQSKKPRSIASILSPIKCSCPYGLYRTIQLQDKPSGDSAKYKLIDKRFLVRGIKKQTNNRKKVRN